MDGVRSVPRVDDRLISYLRSELKDQRLAYTTPPTPVEVGYDTAIYRFQLEGVSDDSPNP